MSATTVRRAHKVHPIAALQLEYSPFSLEIELPDNNLLATCRELGIAVVAYSPLGRGFLTGQLKSPDDFVDGDFRKTAPKYSKTNWGKNMELVDLLVSIAKDKGCTPGQLALAWVLKQGDDILAIPYVSLPRLAHSTDTHILMTDKPKTEEPKTSSIWRRIWARSR